MLKMLKRKICKLITKMDRDENCICITKEDANRLQYLMSITDTEFDIYKDGKRITIYTSL